MTNRPKNTKERGIMEFLVYKEGKTYVGVCLTFDILEEGDNPVELMKSVIEAAQGHLEVVRKLKLPDALLNRYAPREYWNRYRRVIAEIHGKKRVRSPYHFLVSPYAARDL